MFELEADGPEPDVGTENKPVGSRNYGIFRQADRERLMTCTNAIHAAYREGADRLFTIGRELKEAKKLLKHGDFQHWLGCEFNWSQRTANRYMQAVETFGSKAATVSVLGPAAIYALSAKSTPKKIRNAVVAQVEAGETPSLQAVRKKIADSLKAAVVSDADASDDGGRTRLRVSRKPLTSENAQRAANLVLACFGPRKTELLDVLANVDPDHFLAALRVGSIIEIKQPTSVITLDDDEVQPA